MTIKYTWITLVFYLDYTVLLAKRGRGAMWFYSWNEHRLQNVEPRKASKWLRRLNYNETVLTRGQNVVCAFDYQCKTCLNSVVWLKRHLQQILIQESGYYTLNILPRRVPSLSKVGYLGEAHYIRQLVSISQMKNTDMIFFLPQFSKSSLVLGFRTWDVKGVGTEGPLYFTQQVESVNYFKKQTLTKGFRYPINLPENVSMAFIAHWSSGQSTNA